MPFLQPNPNQFLSPIFQTHGSVISEFSDESESSEIGASDLATIRSKSLGLVSCDSTRNPIIESESQRLTVSMNTCISTEDDGIESWNSSSYDFSDTSHSQWCSTSFSSVAKQSSSESLPSLASNLPAFKMFTVLSSDSDIEIWNSNEKSFRSPSFGSSECKNITEEDTTETQNPTENGIESEENETIV